MYWLVGNDKLLANPTHRPTVVTVVVVLRVNATAVEVEVETVVGVGRMERTRPIVTV